MRTRPTLAALACALALPAAAAADDIQPVGSTPVEPVGSTPVEPIHAKPLHAKKQHAKHVSTAYFLGAWTTWVPGTTYTTPGPGDTEIQTTSTGTAPGAVLVIHRNGSYRWHGHHGRWTKTGDADYPILLHHAVDGHDWKVGADRHHRIVIWDGYTWFDGKR